MADSSYSADDSLNKSRLVVVKHLFYSDTGCVRFDADILENCRDFPIDA